MCALLKPPVLRCAVSSTEGSTIRNYQVAEDLPGAVGLSLPNSQIFIYDTFAIGEVGLRLTPFINIASLLNRTHTDHRSRISFTEFRYLFLHVLADCRTTANALSPRATIYRVLCIPWHEHSRIALLHGIYPLLVSCVNL